MLLSSLPSLFSFFLSLSLILIWIVQGLTALVDTPLCLLAIYGILNKKWWLHPVQLVLCACQIYGTLLFFLEAHFNGWVGVTADPFGFWVFIVLLNGLWIVLPAHMMHTSFTELRVVLERDA
jgi:EXPERA (EXPanded EBP superfamily)